MSLVCWTYCFLYNRVSICVVEILMFCVLLVFVLLSLVRYLYALPFSWVHLDPCTHCCVKDSGFHIARLKCNCNLFCAQPPTAYKQGYKCLFHNIYVAFSLSVFLCKAIKPQKTDLLFYLISHHSQLC